MTTYIANSTGQNLEEHCKLTASLSKKIAIKFGCNEDIQKICFIAGLLHDVGKVVGYFQQYIFQKYISGENNVDENNVDKRYLAMPMHNEISWAIISSIYDMPSYVSLLVKNSIYWHHSRPLNNDGTYFESDLEILEKLSEHDLREIEKFADELLESNGFEFEKSQTPILKKVPNIFDGETARSCSINPAILTVKSCLMSADHIVSSLGSDLSEYINDESKQDELLDSLERRVDIPVPSCPEEFNEQRYSDQIRALEDIIEHKNVAVKAPGGWGKTTLGLLWMLKNKGRVFWVCPTNSIAYSVYKNILDAINILGINLTVQYHVAGKIKEQNSECDDFDADIVVTNIDTVLRPASENKKSSQIFDIMSRNIIFDEYHEFKSDAPLFSLFVILMRARTLHTNSKSLCLSATDGILYKMWDCLSDSNKTFVYPNEREHLRPHHSGEYKVKIYDSPLTDIPSYKDGSIVFLNTVKTCQDVYSEHSFDYIAHGKYTDHDKKEKLDEIIEKFGKKNHKSNMGKSVCSTQILQAAIDISFLHMYEAIYSPESTMQRIARDARFGFDINEEHEINIFLYQNKSDSYYVFCTYDNELRARWFNFLKDEFDGRTHASLSHFYSLYNKFNIINEKDILEHLQSLHLSGMKWLVNMGSTKYKEAKDFDENSKHSYKSLRNPEGGVFYSCKINGTDDWLVGDDLMSESINDFKNVLDKGTKIPSKNKMDKLIRSTGGAFPKLDTWSKYSKKQLNMESAISKSRNSETPFLFPEEVRVYDKKLGVVNIK